MFRTRALLYGLAPIPPVIQTDTLKLAKKLFKFNSNKLDYIAKFLGIKGKIETGYGLWSACMKGDQDALNRMVKYNRNDVTILEEVYNKLTPHELIQLNRNLISGANNCPSCGSKKLEKRGFSYTQAGKKQRYQCTDCGHWSHGPLVTTKDIIR